MADKVKLRKWTEPIHSEHSWQRLQKPWAKWERREQRQESRPGLMGLLVQKPKCLFPPGLPAEFLLLFTTHSITTSSMKPSLTSSEKAMCFLLHLSTALQPICPTTTASLRASQDQRLSSPCLYSPGLPKLYNKCLLGKLQIQGEGEDREPRTSRT